MSAELTDDQRQQIIDALYAGRRIDAIKRYRDATGLGLKDSKDIVEKLEAALRSENPDAFQASPAGCAATASLLLSGVVWAGWQLMNA